MSYQISINKPNKSCRIHYSDCSSIKQVIGNRPSDNQEYSEILNSCKDVKTWIENNTNLKATNCGNCNPNC